MLVQIGLHNAHCRRSNVHSRVGSAETGPASRIVLPAAMAEGAAVHNAGMRSLDKAFSDRARWPAVGRRSLRAPVGGLGPHCEYHAEAHLISTDRRESRNKEDKKPTDVFGAASAAGPIR